jgi:YD repeat-containing protein
MKNIQGNTEDLEIHNEGVLVYEYIKVLSDCKRKYYREFTYDLNGNPLTYKNSDGYSYVRTYDANSNELTHTDSDGYTCESTYDEFNNELTFKDSDGYTYEYTRDLKGNPLTYKDSDGTTRKIDVPKQSIIKRLINKLKHLKINKLCK